MDAITVVVMNVHWNVRNMRGFLRQRTVLMRMLRIRKLMMRMLDRILQSSPSFNYFPY